MSQVLTIYSKVLFLNNKQRILLVAPQYLYGEGTYALSSLKEIKVTDDFHQMDEKTKNCQNVEAFEDCTTRKYLEKLDHECSCVPYKLRNFSEINQVD